MRGCALVPKGSKVSERRTMFIRGLALMALAAGLAALLLPPLRQAIGIDRPDRARFAASQQLFTKVLAGRTAPPLQHDAAATGLVATGLNRDLPPDWQGVTLAGAVDGGRSGNGAGRERGGQE